MLNLQKALDFSKNLSLKAGKILLNGQQKVQIKAYKDRQDIVTNIDLLVEKTIIEAIEKEYPEHNISSEEKGFIDKNSDYTWYLDPLDGTKEYYRHIPTYCSAFCLFLRQEPILSVINIPYSNQLFYATSDKGSFLNDRKIKVNNKKSLPDSIIYCHPPCYGKVSKDYFEKVFKIIRDLTKRVYRIRFSPCDNIYLSFLALGSIEAYMNFARPTKGIEDFVSGLFIAKMAGAKITDLIGEPVDFSKAGQFYIASNGKIHDQLLRALKS